MIGPDFLFRSSFPDDFLQDTLRCIFSSYMMARAHCSQYPPSEAHDLYPHERRAIFEHNWRKISAGYPSVNAGSEVNKNKGAYHTEIRSNEVILTANVVDSPSQVVRQANFRKTLAESGQLKFQFEIFNDNNDLDRSKLFAILIHGPSQAVSPAFAQIVFPDRNCRSYLETRIDLFKEYPDILDVYKTPEEEVQPTPIQIRKDIPREEPFEGQA